MLIRKLLECFASALPFNLARSPQQVIKLHSYIWKKIMVSIYVHIVFIWWSNSQRKSLIIIKRTYVGGHFLFFIFLKR